MAPSLDFDVHIDPVAITGPGMVQQGPVDKVHVPERITGSVAGLPWDVRFVVTLSDDDDMVPEISELQVSQRPGGPPIGADTLRSIPVKAIRLRSVDVAATAWVTDAEGRTFLDFARPSPYRLDVVHKRTYHRVTDDDLRKAAGAYADAKRAGRRDHLEYIAEQLNVSRATGARYLTRARAKGMVTEP